MGELRVIGGRWKKRRLISPPAGKLKPTTDRVRAAFFNIVQWQIEGADFLDVFAGTGVVGIEALSRAARAVTFVEAHPLNVKLIERNLERIGSPAVRVLGWKARMALEMLEARGETFTVVFLDPPYDEEYLLEEALGILGRGALLGGRAIVVAETRRGLKMLDAYGVLALRKIHPYGSTRLWVYEREAAP